MTEDFKSLLEAYDKLIIERVWFLLFMSERNLSGEFDEWITEKRLDLNMVESKEE